MKQAYIMAALLAALILGGCGYMRNDSEKESPKSVNDIALEYMEQKYGEKFEYGRPWGNSMSGTREFMSKCESLPGEEVLVQIENFRSEDRVFSDNYLAVKYQEDTIKFIQSCANQVFGESIVFYDVARRGLSPDLPADATFDEYIADPRGFISCYVEVKASNFISRERSEQVIDIIADTCKADELSVIIVAVENDKYGTFDKDSLADYIGLRKYVECMRSTRENGESIKIEWLEEEK